jgi:sugar lactone lactonase YvrE
MEGVYRPNETLRGATVVGKGMIEGAEDVDVDDQGRLVGGTADGRVVRWSADDSIEVVADTGGRPLGLDWDGEGNLVICDAFRGLLLLRREGELQTLATEADGISLGFTDDVAVARDGRLYFSDASTRHDQKHYLRDMLEARPWGRLIRYDPRTRESEVLLKDLYFANGVALSQKQDFVLVNETYRYRISRYWINGPMAGQSDVFLDNLPGFPDGISQSGRGTFWVALPTTRNAVADAIHPHPILKNLVAKLPAFAQPKPAPYGLILEVDEQGRVIRSLHDPGGRRVSFITSVQERGGTLYLGSLTGQGIGVLPLAGLR